MQGFIDSFNPLFSRYKSEIILLCSAVIIALISICVYSWQMNNEKQAPALSEKIETRTMQPKITITIDVSGAVKKPFVYSLPSDARIIDAIQMAGGLTEEADEAFVKRSINYARFLSDQEKIYIPFLSDTANGFIVENRRVIDYIAPNLGTKPLESASRININTASILELDQLPGVGKVISEAIFNGRPYKAIDELVTNSIIKQSVFEKIKDQISIY